MKQGEVWNIFFVLISSVSTIHVKFAHKKCDIMISISRNNRFISFIDKSFFIFQSRSISERLTTISVLNQL